MTCFLARKKDAPPRTVGFLTWGFYMESNGDYAKGGKTNITSSSRHT